MLKKLLEMFLKINIYAKILDYFISIIFTRDNAWLLQYCIGNSIKPVCVKAVQFV